MYRGKGVLAAGLSTILLLSACAGVGSEGADSTTVQGDPVAGGTLTSVQGGEPRSLDPATFMNQWMAQGLLGNALYGTLMINDVDTLEIQYKMASGFSTDDGGSTFTLGLRPGLVFTDGTPLDAEAVKFNWDRLRDPATAGPAFSQASQISTIEVIDATTLKAVMVAPNPHYAQTVVLGAMNWIASPTALRKGPEAFNKSPVGAGPFTLSSWERQNAIELRKNPDYWDSPKPYLDALTLKSAVDTTQRINTITTGGADISTEASWASIANAEAAGLSVETLATGGGQFIAMNTRKAPFDDSRARRGLALAVDLDAMNTAVYNGTGEIPKTLFQDLSPFFTDDALQRTDKSAAQKLFDELAADGKPLTFTFLAYSTPENKAVAEALQTQLSSFDNVEVKIEIMDFAAAYPRFAAHEFEMVIVASTVQDPDAALWNTFHSSSRGNYTGIDDEELDGALDAGRVAPTVAERTAEYEIVQQRLIELNPVVWYTRSAPTVVSANNVHGVEMYTVGSILPEELWLADN